MLFLHIFFLIILFAASGFFSAAETALFSLSKIEKRRLLDHYPKMSRWVMPLLNTPRRTLMTILIGNLFVNTLSAALVTLIAMHSLKVHALWIVMVLYAGLLILFGEIVPKVIAVRSNERVAVLLTPLLWVFVIFLAPIRVLFKKITDWILSFIVSEKRKTVSDSVSEEELKTLIKIGEEDGILDPQERHMIQKVFELGERPVKDIMTPRIDVIAFDIDDSESKHFNLIQKYHFTHFPVYQETIDHLLGVVSSQDYLLSANCGLKALLKQPLFIPETKRIDEVLAELKSRDAHFAVCVDEHGGTDGIVTLEDILEEIFGEYYDEYETVKNPIRRLENGEYLVEAKVSLAVFNEYFSARLEAGEASTLGGYILESLGEVPPQGKVLTVPGFEMRIHDVIRHRIHHVMVRPKT